MTAFDNIKTNNWPATSNDLEDFLVLELPLNDLAALTSSRRDIVAGSKVLYPKKTLTNNGSVESVNAGPLYSANSSGGAFYSTYTWALAFDGALHTGPFVYSTTTNTLTLPAGVTWSNKIRVHALRYSGEFEINGTDILASHTIGTTAAWYDLTATLGSSGTLSTIMIGGVQTNYMKLMAVELDGTILVNPAAIDKHYDKSADFGTISQDKHLTVPASSDFSFGNDPWCIECWAYIRSTPTNGTAVWDFDTSAGFSGSEDWICAYHQSTNMYFYWGATSGYYGINAALTTDQWQHWAWTWDGTTARLFRDGTLAASTTATNKTSGWGSASRNITIGKQNYDSPNRFGDQQIQDLRIYKGTAKYTSNFTPPSAILG